MQRTNHLIVVAGSDRGGQIVYVTRACIKRNRFQPNSHLSGDMCCLSHRRRRLQQRACEDKKIVRQGLS